MDPDKMNHFGANLSPKPVRFQGRIFDPIRVIGGNRNDHFASVCPAKWAFFSFDQRFNHRDIESFINELKQSGRRFGMDLSNCLKKEVIPIDHRNIDDIKAVFANILKYLPSCNLLLIALPQVSILYNLVKHFGDQKFGIITQCLVAEKAKRRNR
ncbi:hypothetical protein BLA29_012308, partial [Euroglyphus maynei]